MIGLIAFAILFTWIAVVIWTARRVSHAMRIKPSLRPLVSVGASVVIFFLPVADELTARPLFRTLCEKSAHVDLKVQSTRDRIVRITVNPSDERVSGMPIPTVRNHFIYQDSSTGEVVIEYDMFQAHGGLVSHVIPLSRGYPITGSFFCSPETDGPIAEKYGFVVLQ